ncbi:MULTISPECIES: hypothetical protein [Achromobacter]|uniref:hypothetical protein n=1 Tax=Achromobacter TaxID=222 RepID=UPI000EEB0165|nr:MULTISPECIES: hypothetical protein [Achromobacter]MDR6602100.1 hypothetical protein [Achromobacter deleyi]HCW18703.1 hypothetical protein [Achromobacter sp.]
MIDGIGRLAQLIQQRTVSGARAGDTARAGKSATAKKAAEPPAFTELLKRVASLAPDDQERERKAFRYFLEAALLSDLGANLINDPKFHQLVDIVQQRMEAQPELLAASQRAARLLLELPPAA